MKKALKWITIALGSLLGFAILIIIAALVCINYEGKKTEAQKESLEFLIKVSEGAPRTNDYSGELPEEVPEIYEDQLETGESEMVTEEGDLGMEQIEAEDSSHTGLGVLVAVVAIILVACGLAARKYKRKSVA